MNKFCRVVVAGVLVVFAAGCATDGQLAQRGDRVAATLNRLGVVRGDTVSSVSEFRINGWHDIDDRYLILTAGRHEHYLVELVHVCPELRGAFNIGLSTRGGSLSRMDSIIVDSLHEPLGRCQIREIYRLEHAE